MRPRRQIRSRQREVWKARRRCKPGDSRQDTRRAVLIACAQAGGYRDFAFTVEQLARLSGRAKSTVARQLERECGHAISEPNLLAVIDGDLPILEVVAPHEPPTFRPVANDPETFGFKRTRDGKATSYRFTDYGLAYLGLEKLPDRPAPQDTDPARTSVQTTGVSQRAPMQSAPQT